MLKLHNKSIIFTCMPLKLCTYWITSIKNNKKGQYLHWLVKISKYKSAQVKVLCLLVHVLNLMYLLNKKKMKIKWK